MAITVNWNNTSKCYIESCFCDPWTVEELLHARKLWYRMIKSVDYRVPILLDLRLSKAVPKGVLRHLAAIHRTPHPRQGHIYIMGMNGNYETLYPYFSEGVAETDKSVRLIDSPDSIISP